MTTIGLNVAAALTALALAAPAQALTFTFDASADLSAHFNTDVLPGDSSTSWHAMYAPAAPYEGSDGGFVHLNGYTTGNSLQFKAGPALLNSFDVSSAFGSGGVGVANAVSAGGDYELTLYNMALEVIYSATHYVAADGAWETLTLNIADVSVIHVAARWSAPNVYDGFWPNVDNITVNRPVASAVPVPATFPLMAAAFGALGLLRRRAGG